MPSKREYTETLTWCRLSLTKGKGKNTTVDQATSCFKCAMCFIAPSSCGLRQEELRIGLMTIWNYYTIKSIQYWRCRALNRKLSYKHQIMVPYKSNILCHKATFIHHHCCAKTALHLQTVLSAQKASVWHIALRLQGRATLRDPRTGGLYPSPIWFIHVFISRRTSRSKWIRSAMQGKEDSYCRMPMKLVQWQLSVTKFRHVSVTLYATTWLPPVGFSWNLIFEDF